MRRREFIGLVGGAAAWPLAARAQQTGKIPVVSVLWHGTREKELSNPFYHWVVQGFEDVGLKPGVNIALDHHFADESDARYNVLAPQMAAERPDVLVAIAVPPTSALKKVHGDIPLVFLGGDPLSLGVIENLSARSEAITGIASTAGDLSGKRLGLLKDAIPSLSRVALLVNPKTKTFTENDIKQYGEAAKSTGVSVQHFNVSGYEEVAAAFAKIVEWQANGVVLSQNPLFSLIREELARAALSLRLPLMTSSDTYVVAGALISYGASLRDALQSGGALVKRLLKGERAGDIPVLLPTKFELFLNMKTAHALGLTFPPQFMAMADHVIE